MAKLEKLRVMRQRQLIRLSQSESLTGMSKAMFHDMTEVFKTWLGTSEASLLSGYAANICVTDFLHSAGLITDRAYEAVFLLETIMSAVSILGGGISALFGAASPFAPTLRTRVLTEGQFSDRADDDDKTFDMAKNAMTLASLVPAVAAAI